MYLQRVVLTGHETTLGDKAVTSLALKRHELATNAFKHGALSGAAGRVSLHCELQGEALLIRWQEDGGPLIDAPPVCEGFGSTLVRNTVSGRFGGLLLAMRWRKQGLIVEFAIPVAKLAE